MKNVKQSNKFKYNGYDIERHYRSYTQGSFSISKDGNNICDNHSMEVSVPVAITNDGRENIFIKTDEEIKQSVDIILEVLERKQKVKDLLSGSELSNDYKEAIANYFTSPAFPDLKDIKDLLQDSYRETKNLVMSFIAFKSGRFTEEHAHIFIECLHTAKYIDRIAAKLFNEDLEPDFELSKGIQALDRVVAPTFCKRILKLHEKAIRETMKTFVRTF